MKSTHNCYAGCFVIAYTPYANLVYTKVHYISTSSSTIVLQYYSTIGIHNLMQGRCKLQIFDTLKKGKYYSQNIILNRIFKLQFRMAIEYAYTVHCIAVEFERERTHGYPDH